MIRTHRAALCALLMLTGSLSALAGEAAGTIKTSRGEVHLERNGQHLPAAVGTGVEVGDRLRTGDDGAAGITLRDGTLLSAGPRALIVVDKFAFDTASQAGRLSVGVRRGTLAVVSGRIAKQTPETVEFHTPTSVLGVRGTEFVIEVEGGRED